MYSKLAFEIFQHRPIRAALGALLIAVGLVAVLVAVGLCHGPATGHSGSAVGRIAFMRPLLRRFASAFLVACAAITFVSTWARLRPRGYELAVLRFLGASKGFVIAMVSTEAALISVVGAVLALVISHGVLDWINSATMAAPPYSIGLKGCVGAAATMIGAAVGGSAIPCAISLQADVREMLERDR